MGVVEWNGRVMASDLQLIVLDPQAGQWADAVGYLHHLEAVWSRFRATSDISRLNCAGGAAVAVDGETLVLVATMLEAWRMTAGGYDPTLLEALVAHGYVTSRDDAMLGEQPPCHPEWYDLERTAPYGANRRRIGVIPGGVSRHRFGADSPRRGAGSLADIALDPVGPTLCLPAGLCLDPGGIGKGLAADLVVRRLLAGGAVGALVAIGGDMAMAGQPPQPDGWPVAVEDPDRPEDTLVRVVVSGGGVATSSTRSRRWRHEGVEKHHQIDPITAAPSTTDLAAVTVIAPTGWEAEAHASAALSRGGVGVVNYLEGHGLHGLAVTTEGTVLRTAGLAHLDIDGDVQRIGARR